MITLLLTIQIYASYGCGFAPLNPPGCWNGTPTCICDDNDKCYWIFVGCEK